MKHIHLITLFKKLFLTKIIGELDKDVNITAFSRIPQELYHQVTLSQHELGRAGDQNSLGNWLVGCDKSLGHLLAP